MKPDLWSDPIPVSGPPEDFDPAQIVCALRAGRWIGPMRFDALDWGDWFTGKGPQITHIRTLVEEGDDGR